MDVDGDEIPDLDPSRVYYFGHSLGGIYGTLFLAVEPSVHAGVPNAAGGSFIEASRLSPVGRPLVGVALAARVPSLINIGGIQFNENLPLRDQPPVINTVPGAIAIQEVFEWAEWVQQSGDSVAYSLHLRKQPLEGMPAKSIIFQFAKGDQQVPNPTSTAMLRAGDLADRATYYRHDLAFADPLRNPTGVEVPKDPHIFLVFHSFLEIFPAVGDVGAGTRQQIAEFFASDGETIIDPDRAGPLFEVPIIPPLPEELNFIP
jgi:pimeloyl-ACP methyl ester carboxylesterase